MNVWGDSVGAGVVEALSKSKLAEMDEEEKMKALEFPEKGYPDNSYPYNGSSNPGYDNTELEGSRL